MTNTALLEKIIKDKGIKKARIAKAIGVSYGWLKKKINNEVDFKACEIQELCSLLGIDDLELKDKIFFDKDVGK